MTDRRIPVPDMSAEELAKALEQAEHIEAGIAAGKATNLVGAVNELIKRVRALAAYAIPAACKGVMAELKIETGKFYRTRDGQKVEVTRVDDVGHYPVRGTFEAGAACAWSRDGLLQSGLETEIDLVAEWVDEPAPEPVQTAGHVRTVTRKEIVPGAYDRLTVNFAEVGRVGIGVAPGICTTSDLTRLITDLTAIRDALAEQRAKSHD